MKRPLTKLTSAILLSGLMIFGLNSCTQDYFKLDTLKEDPFTWEPDLAFPLVNSSLAASDILTQVDSTNIYLTEDDGFVTLIYRNVVFSQTINDLFVLPNLIPLLFDSRQLSTTEANDLNTNGSIQVAFSGDQSFDLENVSGQPSAGQLEFIEFHEGSGMDINLIGDFMMEGSVTVTYPEIVLNGNPLTHVFNFDNTPGNGIDQSVTKDISNYRLMLNSPSPNNIEAQYILTLNGNGATTSNSVLVTSMLSNSSIGLANGDFGQIDLQIDPDVVDIDILDNQQDGEITFVDPRLKITIENSFGMSFLGTINQMRAIGDGAEYIDVVYNGVTNPSFLITGANAPGESDSTVWYFTGTQNTNPGANSNIDEVVNANYEDMVFDLDVSTNPPGGTPFPNWASRTSAVEVTADVELPFWGTAQDFTLRDTIDFPIAEAENLSDNILEALLRVSTDNGFPVDGKLKLYFADSVYTVTDSVLADGQSLIQSGMIDGNGRVTSSTVTNNDIVLDENRIANVFGARYIILDAIMNSTNNGQSPIRIYDDYELGVSLGFQVKLSASPSDIGGL